MRTFRVFGIKNRRSAAVRGARAGCTPPPGSASALTGRAALCRGQWVTKWTTVRAGISSKMFTGIK